MTIKIETDKRRRYLTGDTYPFRDQIRAAGCRWDPDRKAWWTAKADVAERIVRECEGLAAGEHTLCPPKKYNTIVRQNGGVWDETRRAWVFATAEAKAAAEREIASRTSRATREREEVAKAEAARKLASTKSAEQLLADAGRERRDGDRRTYILPLGHGRRVQVARAMPEVGEIVPRKDGPWMIVEVGQMTLVTDDMIEDMDAWSTYRDGSGWYVDYAAIPVRPTTQEAARQAAAEAKATAESRLREITHIVQQSSNAVEDIADPASLTPVRYTGRAGGSESLSADEHRIVYSTSSYDDGPRHWELRDAALAAEALRLRETVA